MRNRKEGRKKKKQEKDKERESEKGGPKKAKLKQRETQNNEHQKWFFRGKNRVFILKTKKGKQRKNKWATSPDP